MGNRSLERLSLDEVRRLALAAQGFGRPRPRTQVTIAHIRRTIRRLGLLQLDYVNVLVPAHYLVLFSRLGAYERSKLDDLVYGRGEFTEQWAHEASIVPMETWPLLAHRRVAHRVRPWGFEKFLAKHAQYAGRVLEEIRNRGPLGADDLPEPEGAPRRMSDKWGWGLAVRRQVLEAHFGFGRLAVTERAPNFSRRYDLAERVIPEPHHGRTLSTDEAQRELLRLAARALGIGTVADLADYYRMPVREARPRIAELVAGRALTEVRVERWKEPAYRDPAARAPRSVTAASLLSPFDPLIWFRPRTARVFDFDYRLETFTPAAKRKWGYYVLPFLLGDRLVARVDLKADRTARRLRVLAADLEQGAARVPVADRLARELWTVARWLELDDVAVEGRTVFARHLGHAILHH